jgi:hypothetical protein
MLEPVTLETVSVIRNDPPAVGVPPSVAVPFPLSVNVTPAGSEPVSMILGAGEPAVITVKELATPAWNVAVAALVTVGG